MLVVRLEDPGLGLDDLAQRPEGDALAVGQAAPVTPGGQLWPVVECGTELGDETALADPRLSDNGDELHRGLTLCAEERLEQHRQLVLAPDERCVGCGLGQTDSAPGVGGTPDLDRLRLPLRGNGVERLERDDAFRRTPRRLVDDDGAHRRGRLQARRGVDDVARDDALSTFRARTQGDDGLARRNCRAHGDVETVGTQLLDRLEDPERRADSALGIVLV